MTNLPWGFIFELRGETEPKHPTQLYESLSYLVLGLIMLWVYAKKLNKVHRGFFMGFFFVVCFGMRFIIEFIKEPQVEFEQSMTLNMGQIPCVLLGIAMLVYAAVKKKPAAVVHPAPASKAETHYAKPLN